jgi:centrosomal protein CEP290
LQCGQQHLIQQNQRLQEKEETINSLLKDHGDKDELIRLSAANQRLSQEVGDWKARVSALQATLKDAKQTAQHSTDSTNENQSLRQQLQETQSERERLGQEVDRLRGAFDRMEQENADLKIELEAFDPSFFDELEDLKFNYGEAVRMNTEFQERIRDLESQLADDFPLQQ